MNVEQKIESFPTLSDAFIQFTDAWHKNLDYSIHSNSFLSNMRKAVVYHLPSNFEIKLDVFEFQMNAIRDTYICEQYKKYY